MPTTTPDRVSPGGADAFFILELIAAPPQLLLGLLPRTCHRALLWLIGRRADSASRGTAFGLSILALALAVLIFLALLFVALFALAVWAGFYPIFVEQLIARGVIDESSGWNNTVPSGGMTQGMYALLIAYATGLSFGPYEAFGRRSHPPGHLVGASHARTRGCSS